jgi:hypothetical protein
MTFSCPKSHRPPRLCLGTFSKFDKKWSKIFFRDFGFKRLFLTNFYTNFNLKKWYFLVTKVTDHLDYALVHFWSLTKNDQIFFRDFGPKRLLLTNFYTNHNSENMTFSCHKSHQPPRLCLGTFLKFDKKWPKFFFVILVLKDYLWQIFTQNIILKNDFSCHKSHQPPRLCLGTFLKFDKKWSKFFFVILVLKDYFWQIFTQTIILKIWLFLVTKVTNHLDHALVFRRFFEVWQ